MPQAALLAAPPRKARQPVIFANPPDDRTIRTPKRGAMRAAQVWDGTGHWLVGLYPDRRTARAAARAFMAHPERFPEARRFKLRCLAHGSRYKWVRRVKGLNSWQARPWLGHEMGSLNLGIFSGADHGDLAEWTAGQVAKAFGRLWAPGVTVGQAVERLKRTPREAERCRADLEVPARLRDLLPPSAPAPVESAAEVARREARALKRTNRKRERSNRLFAA